MNLQKLDLYKHDLQMVSELIYETDQNLFRTFLDKNPKIAIEKLRKLIVAGRNSYGYEHVYVEEDLNGKIMGILVAFRGDEVKYLEETMIFWNTMGIFDFLKLSLIKPVYDMITASSIGNNDFYIGNIAVANGLRGKGIGTQILKDSFKLASDKKCMRVLLDVIFENKNAKMLYERIGFNVCGEKRFKWLGKSEGTYGMEYILDI
jgi:ribosomal protein S18 acetylase RimI-like enzyme